MKKIFEIKAENVMAAPGYWVQEAEAMVTGPDVAEEVYVNVSMSAEWTQYVVADHSVMVEYSEKAIPDEDLGEEIDRMVEAIQRGEHVDIQADDDEDAYIECYEKLKDAKESKYYEVFKLLDQILKAMEKPVE